MTREEAIEIFKRLKENAPNEMHLETIGSAQELFSMAISALEQNEKAEEWYKLFVEKLDEQEPCTDAVSRQKLLEVVTGNDFKTDFPRMSKSLTEIIKALPSVTQKSGKWIPFSERLPKPFEHCLITTTDGEVIYHYDDGHYSKYKAWMPLPEPYEPQESEDKERIKAIPSAEPNMTWVTGADGAKIAFKDVPVWKVTKICEILGEPQESEEQTE